MDICDVRVGQTVAFPACERGSHTAGKGEYVDWTDPNLKRVTRLRLLSDPGFPMWDVSYCFGEMKDGRCVRVQLPFDQLPKGGRLQRTIIEYAKRDKVYAKGLGILQAISTLN